MPHLSINANYFSSWFHIYNVKKVYYLYQLSALHLINIWYTIITKKQRNKETRKAGSINGSNDNYDNKVFGILFQ